MSCSRIVEKQEDKKDKNDYCVSEREAQLVQTHFPLVQLELCFEVTSCSPRLPVDETDWDHNRDSDRCPTTWEQFGRNPRAHCVGGGVWGAESARYQFLFFFSPWVGVLCMCERVSLRPREH